MKALSIQRYTHVAGGTIPRIPSLSLSVGGNARPLLYKGSETRLNPFL